MKHENIRQMTLNVLFAYIIIFTTVTSSTVNKLGLVLVAGMGGLYFFMNGLKIKSHPLLNSMFFYGVFAFFAMFYSETPFEKSRSVFISYISIFIVIFVIVLTVNDEKDVKKLLTAFAISAVVQCIYMLSVYGVNIFRVIAESENGIRIGDEVSNSNSVGISFALSSVISLDFFLNEKLSKSRKLFYGMLILIGMLFSLLSGSRKATLLLVAGFFLVLFLRNSGKKNTTNKLGGIIFAIVVAGGILAMISSSQLFSTLSTRITSLIDGLRGVGELDASSELRFEMMETGWKAFTESPLWGNGLYSSYSYFETYSHNNFIEILMNTGILGFVIFYYPYLLNIKAFIKLDKKERFYPIMLLIFVWVFIGGVGIVTYYSKDTMTLMALVSLWLSMKRRELNEKDNKCNKCNKCNKTSQYTVYQSFK